jgi:hypothetical protein
MKITSLEQMEEIVEKNNSLSWDGWTVLISKNSPTAWMKPNARFVDGKWYRVDKIEPGPLGWEISSNLVR